MKHLKKIISGGFIGIGIGFTINLMISFFSGEYYLGAPSFLAQYDSTVIAMAVQTLIFMTLGITQFYSVAIMDNQKRSLLSNTLIHFSVIFLPLLVAAYLLHWSRDFLGLFLIGASILLVYLGIWLVSYFYIKAQINRINQTLMNKNK